MSVGVLKSMLLLDEPNISGLRLGIENYSKAFILVSFTGALVWEFFNEMKFMGVVKNLVLALVFMGFFYQFHTEAVDLSFKASEALLREVSPRNIFLRPWSEVKVKTTETSNSFVDKFIVPNLNDLLGTALFLLSKICIWILKLIYTTVYHFTYLFAPITAVLSFFPVSKGSMSGTITSSLWCILLPLVLVVFLALVGNAVQIPAQHGELAISSMDHLIWIFGITLLMLLAPSFTFSLIKGSVASTADAIGLKMTGMGAKALIAPTVIYGMVQKFKSNAAKKAIAAQFNQRKNYGKNNNFYNKKGNNADLKNHFYKGNSAQGISGRNSQGKAQANSKETGGFNQQLPNTNTGTGKISEMKVSHQTQKQNSNIKSAINFSKGKMNNPSSKIPTGSTNKQSGQSFMNFKPIGNAVSKNTGGERLNSRNVFKRDDQIKQIERNFRLERISPSKLKSINPRERLREV
jgi:hypothetical protein